MPRNRVAALREVILRPVGGSGVLAVTACPRAITAMDADVCQRLGRPSLDYADDRGEGAVGNYRRRECD